MTWSHSMQNAYCGSFALGITLFCIICRKTLTQIVLLLGKTMVCNMSHHNAVDRIYSHQIKCDHE